MKINKIAQPVFYYTKKQLPVKAGGVIFYHIDGMNINFLMINNRDKYEDFGGKTDPKDSNYEETVAREVEEESNNIFKKTDILKKIKNMVPIYTKHSKYLLYFIEIDKLLDPVKFGDCEIYENFPRTVEWISVFDLKNPKFIKEKLNFRLRFKEFFDKVDEIIIKVNDELAEELKI